MCGSFGATHACRAGEVERNVSNLMAHLARARSHSDLLAPGHRTLRLARTGRWRTGGARPLCPGTSDINLLRNRERVVDFDSQIADGAFDLRVAQQKLDRSKIAGAPMDQCRLCPS